MRIDEDFLYDYFNSKGLKYLYHANSVKTSCNFLSHDALLSRGAVERLNLLQSTQSSDKIDKEYGIWFDVWLDTVDIHKRRDDINFYGPVLFELKNKILFSIESGEWWITKLNPTKWAGKTEHEKWFQSTQEVKNDFQIGTFDHILVLRHSGGQLNYKKNVNKIILDDPNLIQISTEIDLHSQAYGALQASMKDSKYYCKIERRMCSIDCKCISNWFKDQERLFKLFDPIN